jgi:hypothetical protein
MKEQTYIKHIKRYAIASIIFPLIAINLCLAIYIILGSFRPALNVYDYDKKEFTQGFNEYKKTLNMDASEYGEYNKSAKDFFNKNRNPPSSDNYSYLNCSKNKIERYYVTTDKKKILFLRPSKVSKSAYKEFLSIEKDLWTNNKIESVLWKENNIKNTGCIKNNKYLYILLNKFKFLESFMLHSLKNNPSGFVNVKNPYLYGEVSISRTARYWPTSFIFKNLMLLCSFCLFMYWRNNLNLLKNIIPNQFTRNFYYFGMLSSIFLLLHATFLGMDFDSKLLSNMRRSILLLFIVFEICAQFSLTKILIKNKYNLRDYLSYTILKIKVIFVGLIIILTSFFIFIFFWSDFSSEFKHVLEWNYFPILLIYYYLSLNLWNQKT